MNITNNNIISRSTRDLDAPLKIIEQQCQAIRWRLNNFTDAKSIRRLETEIGTLAGSACEVSRLYGRLEAMTGLQAECPIPFDSEVAGFPMAGSSSGKTKEANEAVQAENQEAAVKGSDLVEKTYKVIEFFGDTEIVEAQGEAGKYPTFEAAKSAAINYLEDAIEVCELAMEVLRYADTPEQYFGTEAPAVSKADGNVRFICKDAYTPDPEIQAKPLPWFVGKLVKLEFSIPGRLDNGEIMWVAVTSVRGDELVGTLANDPLFADQCCGDEIVFRREDVLVVQEDGVGV